MPVYLIQAGENGPVKIGFAAHVTIRLADLQSAHYEELRLLRTVSDAGRNVERWLHRQFREQRIRGEWFRFDPAMLTVDVSTVMRVTDPRQHELPARRRVTRTARTASGMRARKRVKLSHPLMRYLRAAGLSVEDFADQIGITHPTIYRWLNGRRQPQDVETFVLIEGATGGAVTRADLRPDMFGEQPALSHQDAA